MTPTPELVALPERSEFDGNTGIYVRAKCDGKWGSHDIAELSGDSLLAWLRADGGCNALAENTLLTLFNHEQVARQDRAAAQPQGAWLPIESAPRDGTNILLKIRWSEIPLIGHFSHNRWWAETEHYETQCGAYCYGGSPSTASGTEPTHWQPLPTPPPAELGEGDSQ